MTAKEVLVAKGEDLVANVTVLVAISSPGNMKQLGVFLFPRGGDVSTLQDYSLDGIYYPLPVSKRVLFLNVSYENEFDLHENALTDEMHFHNNGFTQRLILTQRHKATGKWPICWDPFITSGQLLTSWDL